MGKRNVGRPKLRYIDQIKSDMKNSNIDINTWQRYSSIELCGGQQYVMAQ